MIVTVHGQAFRSHIFGVCIDIVMHIVKGHAEICRGQQIHLAALRTDFPVFAQDACPLLRARMAFEVGFFRIHGGAAAYEQTRLTCLAIALQRKTRLL